MILAFFLYHTSIFINIHLVMVKGDALEWGRNQLLFLSLYSVSVSEAGFLLVIILPEFSARILSKIFIHPLFSGIFQLLISGLIFSFSPFPSICSASLPDSTHLLMRGEGQPRMRIRMVERASWKLIIIRRRLWELPLPFFSFQIFATNIGWCTDRIFFLDSKIQPQLNIHQERDYFPGYLRLLISSSANLFSQMMLRRRDPATYILSKTYENLRNATAIYLSSWFQTT